MRTTFEIEGLRDLEASMMELSRSTNKRIAVKALTDAAEPLVDRASDLAPVLSGDLSMNIEVSTKLSRRQKTRHRKTSDVEVFVGPNSTVSQEAVQQEFGNDHHGPQAFMRPAWDASKMDVLLNVKSDLATHIATAVARARRRGG